jgi:hypothetical protein
MRISSSKKSAPGVVQGPEGSGQTLEQPQGAVLLSGSPESDSDSPKPAKLTLPLNPNGSIDLSSMRSSTRDRLVDAVSRTPQITKSESGAKAEGWGLPDCEHAYRILGEIEAWLMGNEAWRFSEEEIKELKEPTVEVLNKYLAGVAGPESRLLMAFAGVHLKKYIALKAILALQRLNHPGLTIVAEKNGGIHEPTVSETEATASPGSQSWQIKESR